MPIRENQLAPDFQTRDIAGNHVRISALKGKKIMLTFYRHVGCPFSNLRLLELQKLDSYFRVMGLEVLAVYESSGERSKGYSRNEAFYARVIANPEYDLYSLYDIEQSTSKKLYSMYRGAFVKREGGLRRFKETFCAEVAAGKRCPPWHSLHWARTAHICGRHLFLSLADNDALKGCLNESALNR